jgi:hypothetical protein
VSVAKSSTWRYLIIKYIYHTQIKYEEKFMELKKGDKLIFEPAEVIEVKGKFVRVQFPGTSKTNSFIYSEMPNYIKVLGLVGDPGLEAEVGMEVYDSTFGHGKITVIWGTGIGVVFNSGYNENYTSDGNRYLYAKRTLYVTKKKPEKLGWAWVKDTDGLPYTVCATTEFLAKSTFGDQLIHWIPMENK